MNDLSYRPEGTGELVVDDHDDVSDLQVHYFLESWKVVPEKVLPKLVSQYLAMLPSSSAQDLRALIDDLG